MELAVVIAGIFLLYLLQLTGYRLFWDKGLTVRLSFQREPIREGETACLYERLTNRKRLALLVVHVMFDISRNGRACQKEELASDQNRQRRQKKIWFLSEILSLHANEKKERKIEIKGLKRGLYRIPELRLTASNLFLTDRFSVSTVSDGRTKNDPDEVAGEESGQLLYCNSSLYVYPKSLPEQELKPLFQLLSDQFLTERYSYEDMFEIRGIREYQSFDPMKRVNWKASARTGLLQVNQMEYAASQRVILVLAFGETTGEETDPKREYAVSLTAGAAEYCLEQGIPVGLLSNGEDFLTETPLRIETCGGRAGREALQQGLSRLCFPRKLADMEQILKEALESEGKGMTYVILDASGDTDGNRPGGCLRRLCQDYGTDVISWEV